MKRITWVIAFLLLGAGLSHLLDAERVEARPRAALKSTTNRVENQQENKETLVLPYAFGSESLGATFGVGGGFKGYLQEQLLVGGTVFGSTDEASGIVLAVYDYKLPATERFFFSFIGSMGYYPRQRAYTEFPGGYTGVRAGSNDSDKDDYIEDSGTDNWWEVKLEYVLPIGSMQQRATAQYTLQRGLLSKGQSGGEQWNPLTTGATVAVLRQFNRYQKYETDDGDIDGTLHAIEFGLLYNNTDFAGNPSKGCSQYLSFTQNFDWLDSESDWNFMEFEASKYFSLGATDLARQQVVALNLWTGYSPSTEIVTNADGSISRESAPPFLEGARLGGFYRLRAYPNNRFNDRAVFYSTAEYRFTPHWNPIGEAHLLRWLKMDWMQFVGFIEGGRVAEDYGDLFSDWKTDAGLGLRAMVAGAVVRFDFAVSEEGASGWVMFGHPF